MMMSQSCEDLSLVIVFPAFLSVFCLIISSIKVILYALNIIKVRWFPSVSKLFNRLWSKISCTDVESLFNNL